MTTPTALKDYNVIRKGGIGIGGPSEIIMRPKKKIVVFQVPCQKKTGSVGRLYFFFFFFFFLDKT